MVNWLCEDATFTYFRAEHWLLSLIPLVVITARPAFYKYITRMLALNGLSLFACALAANGAHFGLWLYGITSVCYHSFYLPLLYVTFLADFFQQEEDLNLENVYYSEMKDAGFFDAD